MIQKLIIHFSVLLWFLCMRCSTRQPPSPPLPPSLPHHSSQKTTEIKKKKLQSHTKGSDGSKTRALCALLHILRINEANKEGVLRSPVSVCTAFWGTILISDKDKGKIFSARLHYPVDVTEVDSGLNNPVGIAFKDG